MSIRRLIVEVDVRSVNVRRFCVDHGVSTWFFYDLRRRFARDGDPALEPRGRAPKRTANKMDPALEDLIVSLRKDLTEAGKDAGPATIWNILSDRATAGVGPERVPSEAGIWRALKRRGFIVADPSKAPKSATKRFQAERANELWQIDDTAWTLADGAEAKIIDVVDDRSRTCVSSLVVPACTGEAALEAMTRGAERWGWPERFLSDNARAFQVALAGALAPLGVSSGRSRPYHPQTNGKVERFHQTLKRYLAARDPAATIAELQAQVDAFVAFYNFERRHRGIDRQIPALVWEESPKSGPSTRALGAATAVHRSTVSTGIASAGRVRVSIGSAYDGKQATAVVTGLTCRVFVEGQLVRELTIDPARKLQPLHSRRGRPSSRTA